jgi:predicted DNA-binding helix-hairpin-helix protein
VSDTPFENLSATAPLREHRLYQSSFLLRDYGWDVEELPFVDEGNLRLDVDPKRAWADIHLRHAPIDLMHADRGALLRVPGIGPKSADSILRARRLSSLRDLGDLRKLGINAPDQTVPYVLFDGRRLPQQVAMF